jgi:hypothetical protein
MEAAQSPQEYFRLLLLTVVGQAFSAAGYTLEERPTQWAGGLYRFVKTLESDLYAFIEFQHLHYTDGSPSRFTVTLARSDQPNPRLLSTESRSARRGLPALVVEDFGVPILPSADHWWTFESVDQLGRALGEAGSLAVGYGMPWLSGDLQPPTRED